MEHLVTPAAPSEVSTPTEVAASIPRLSRDPEKRRRHILNLREGIAIGEYHVSASDLADALVRALRRSN